MRCATFGPRSAAVACVGLTLLLLAACLPESSTDSQSPQELLSAGATQAAQMAPPTATAFIVEFVVSGDTASESHLVDIRWSTGVIDDAETSVELADGVWSRFFTVVPGSELTLEATNSDHDDTRPVHCEIYLSGRLWASNESDGARAVCTAMAGW